METIKELLTGIFIGSILLWSTWIAIRKVSQIQFSSNQQTLLLILVIGLKVPLYLWIINKVSSFSFYFWVGWGTIYFLLLGFIVLRSLIQVQINK